MAVNVYIDVTPEEYHLIKSTDYIDLNLTLTTTNVRDVIKLEVRE